ncbi:hydantoinase/oxoprolinase family protein, partial [Streptomyces sp. SID11233]|nr:hydantoinase/oxoprolinase family protein [Streptomyces sp. SID11233]
LSQNDGTLMDVDYARRYPVATFASGPTNSMRGAAFLSRLPSCAVVDIGGTTSDVGILQNGFPREASADV